VTLRVGLTGSLAAGKSTVGRLLAARGGVLIAADELAREAVRPGSPALDEIRAEFGDRVLGPDGGLDRSAMRAVAFADPDARRRLEEIVHTRVRELRRRRHEELEAAGARVVLDEIPLLFEVGLEDEFDAIVVVDAAPDLRRRRAMETRGWTAEEFDAIEASQTPAAEKVARADLVIRNDGDETALARAADAVWLELDDRARERRSGRRAPVDGESRRA